MNAFLQRSYCTSEGYEMRLVAFAGAVETVIVGLFWRCYRDSRFKGLLSMTTVDVLMYISQKHRVTSQTDIVRH